MSTYRHMRYARPPLHKQPLPTWPCHHNQSLTIHPAPSCHHSQPRPADSLPQSLLLSQTLQKHARPERRNFRTASPIRSIQTRCFLL